jgi:hypothetical protein
MFMVINKWDSGETALIHCVQCGISCLCLLYISGTVEREPSYIVFSAGFHVYGYYI